MKCEEVQQLLIDYQDNKIENALHEELAKHLETCDKCRTEAQEMKSVLQSISEVPFEKPDERLRKNFNTMVQNELNKLHSFTEHNGTTKSKSVIQSFSPLLKIAAGFALLIVGVLIGLKLKTVSKSPQSDQLTDLRKEVKEMKEVLMLTMIDQTSASQRIKAVNYADDISNPNPKVINALINTLNTDRNVNVRLAAAYSLAKFADNASVRDSLVESLGKQTEPIIQVVLINTLAEKREFKAIKPMQEIISNKNSLQEVKDIALKCIKTML